MGRHAIALLVWIWAGTSYAQFPDAYPIPPQGPPPAFLVVDQERVLRESRVGQAILRENEAEATALREEGERLDRQFEAEERALTERRPTLPPEEFRELADAFDEKVVATRREQQDKAAALATRSERRQLQFFRQVAPILLQILEETGAAAVVEERILLISKGDLNITDEVIKRLDAEFDREGGAGPARSE